MSCCYRYRRAATALLGRRTQYIAAMSMSTSSTMELDSYAVTSKNQYAAHTKTRDLLSASMERMAQRCLFEDRATCLDGTPRRRRQIVDLGSADGTSSVATLQFAVGSLNQALRSKSTHDGHIPLKVIFEEHPNSDKTKLQATLDQYSGWFQKNNIAHEVLMKSFYEPLFDAESVDFFMSYICLHWLDTSSLPDDNSIAQWKNLGIDDKQSELLRDFVQINEISAPESARQLWREELAHHHLAKFLALRAKEMRPGAEALLVMVGSPHGYLTPSDGGPSPLTRAMLNVVERGDLREDVLRRTIVPYFLRTTEDIKEAVRLAADIEIGEGSASLGSSDDVASTKPGALLELLDCRSFQTITAGSDGDIIGGAFDLFWSIHSNSIISAGPTSDELNKVKMETRRVFHEVYDPEEGIPSTFVAFSVRKRTRRKWGK